MSLWTAPLDHLAQAAVTCRERQRHAGRITAKCHTVTHVIERIINYTNICVTPCSFCAFYRAKKAPDAYVLAVSEIDQKITELIALGGTQILMQGGHNPNLAFQWYLDLLRHINREFPTIHIHAFSPTEITFLSKVHGWPVCDILAAFKEHGLRSIPGGGAEIFSPKVRQHIAPTKASAAEWLSVMREAHRQGIPTSATMMFGHIEHVGDRIDHLNRIRELQDDTGGFVSFIPWTFMPGNSLLSISKASADDYLRTVAISRIFLDNIANLQASWVTQGPEVVERAVAFGVNDVGGILIEENVIRSTGFHYSVTIADILEFCSRTKLESPQRDFYYRDVTPRGDARPLHLR